MAHHIACRDAGYDCDFVLESENEDEMVEFVRQHAENTHDVKMSRSDVRGMLQEV